MVQCFSAVCILQNLQVYAAFSVTVVIRKSEKRRYYGSSVTGSSCYLKDPEMHVCNFPQTLTICDYMKETSF